MAKKLLPRRGAATQHDLFAGDIGELTVDTTNFSVVVHDGITKGGHNHARDTAPLRGIKFLRRIPNVIQTTLGYHNDSNVGGGQWVYNPTRSWAAHDGGTVIAYPSLALYTGTIDTLAYVLQWNASALGVSGAGCWERVSVETLNITWFGAIANSTFDNAPVYEKIRQFHPTELLFFPAVAVGSYATSRPFITTGGARNIGGGETNRTSIVGLGSHPLFQLTGHSCEVANFTLSTLGDATNPVTRGIYVTGANSKVKISNLWSGSKFSTLIYSDAEIDQSWIYDIVTFHNHVRGTIDIDTAILAQAPTGAAVIERVWITPTGLIGGSKPSLFGVRLGRTDSCDVRNCIINETQNEILIDNSGDEVQRNWALRISNVHMETGYQLSVTRWVGNEVVSAGTIRRPTKEKANGYCYIAQNSGTTAPTEPTWPADNQIGNEQSVTDNGVVWLPHYSKTAIRLTGDVATSMNITISAIQTESHWVTILDRGNNLELSNMRQLGSNDYYYKRSADMGVDSHLKVSNSNLGGDFTLQVGSTRTWFSCDSTSIGSTSKGVPSNISRTSTVVGSKLHRNAKPTITSVGISGEVVTLGSLLLDINATACVIIKFNVKVIDAGFTARDFSNVTLTGVAIRVFNSAPIVNFTPLEVTRTTDNKTLTFVYGSTYSDGKLTITAAGTSNRVDGRLRYSVHSIELLSEEKTSTIG